MEPFTVIASSLGLAAGIAKASAAVSDIPIDLRNSSADFLLIKNELAIFQSLIEPLATGLSRVGSLSGPSLAPLLGQISSAVTGALAVVERFDSLLSKYRGKLTIWAKLRWSMFGNDQIRKLRESLGSYKVALGIGLHVLSICIVGEIRGDAEVIREVSENIKILQQDEILGRLVSKSKSTDARTRVDQWLEKMIDYTTSAETAYQATITDLHEEPVRPISFISSIPNLQSARLEMDPIPECDGDAGGRSSGETSTLRGEYNGKNRTSPTKTPSVSHRVGSEHVVAQTNDAGLPSQTIISSSVGYGTCKTGMASNVPSNPRNFLRTNSQALPLGEFSHGGPSMEVKAKKIDWSPLIPDIISKTDFQDIRRGVRIDADAIRCSKERRLELPDSDRELLDNKLLQIISQDPKALHPNKAIFCQALFAMGASIEATKSPAYNPLIELVEQRDWQTLSLLLRQGADPDGDKSADPRQPLAVAASYDPQCLCALILAGAQMRNMERNKKVCRLFCRKRSRKNKRRVCCVPLLAAFARLRQRGRINMPQFWVTQFLLVNGADVNYHSCTTVMDMMVERWPLASQYRMTRHFLAFGLHMASPGLAVQLRRAAMAGEWPLIQLHVDNGIDIKDVSQTGVPQIDPLVLAAKHQHWDCFEILVKAATDPTHLYNLIHVFMLKSSMDLSPAAFYRAVSEVLARRPNIDLGARLLWHYPRQMEPGDTRVVGEIVSVVDLAERIINEKYRDRAEVLWLLTKETHGARAAQTVS